jgi:hypothetical protein
MQKARRSAQPIVGILQEAERTSTISETPRRAPRELGAPAARA